VPKLPIILFTLYRDAVPKNLAKGFGIGAIAQKAARIELMHNEVQRLTKQVGAASVRQSMSFPE
jgi:hypothetical protein